MGACNSDMRSVASGRRWGVNWHSIRSAGSVGSDPGQHRSTPVYYWQLIFTSLLNHSTCPYLDNQKKIRGLWFLREKMRFINYVCSAYYSCLRHFLRSWYALDRSRIFSQALPCPLPTTWVPLNLEIHSRFHSKSLDCIITFQQVWSQSTINCPDFLHNLRPLFNGIKCVSRHPNRYSTSIQSYLSRGFVESNYFHCPSFVSNNNTELIELSLYLL